MPRPLRRWLCFGDSLTRGYVTTESGFVRYRPYADTLRRLCCPRAVDEILTDGVDGATTRDRRGDFDSWVADSSQGTIPPLDLIVLLLGTNDLGYQEVEEAIVNLRNMHRSATAQGIRTVAMSVPPVMRWRGSSAVPPPAQGPAHRALCDALRAIAGESGGKTLYVDLAFAAEHADWWSDPLHFSDLGYAGVARHLVDRLVAARWLDGALLESEASQPFLDPSADK